MEINNGTSWGRSMFRSVGARKLWKFQYGKGSAISNPFTYAMMRTFRSELNNRQLLRDAAPCVLYLQSLWDGKIVDGTRMGGLPGRDPSLQWPLSLEGELPLMFLAQFDFSQCPFKLPYIDSRQLLHVYAENLGGHLDMNLQFQWHQRDNCQIPARELLPAKLEILSGFYGVQCYENDYKKFDFDGSAMKVGSEERVPVLRGTKIGGLDPLSAEIIKDGDCVRVLGDSPPEDGRFLCCIGSVCPSPGVEWPYVGSKAPIASSHLSAAINIGDGWAISIYVTAERHLLWLPIIG